MLYAGINVRARPRHDGHLQVLGNVKGVVAVVASILWFRNPVNVASMMGYGITVAGVVAYSQVCASPRRPLTLCCSCIRNGNAARC